MGVVVELKTPDTNKMNDNDILIKKGNALIPISKKEYLKDLTNEIALLKSEIAQTKEIVRQQSKQLADILKAIINVEANKWKK